MDAIATVLGLVTLAGVVTAAWMLLPRDPVAGVIGAVLLVLAPPFRAAPHVTLLAAAGTVWALAFTIRSARRTPRAPALLALGVLAMIASIAAGLFAHGGLGFAPDLAAAVASTGQGAAAIVVGAGLLGASFAAITDLPAARWLLLAIALAGAGAVLVAPAPAMLLAVLAVAIAVIPSAAVRIAGSPHRHLIALAAGVPLIVAALAIGVR